MTASLAIPNIKNLNYFWGRWIYIFVDNQVSFYPFIKTFYYYFLGNSLDQPYKTEGFKYVIKCLLVDFSYGLIFLHLNDMSAKFYFFANLVLLKVI